MWSQRQIHSKRSSLAVCKLCFMTPTSSLSFVDLQKINIKRPWSEHEKRAIHKHLGKFITERRVPRKMDCTQVLNAEKVLAQRSWKDIKNWVYNTITTLNRKSATRSLFQCERLCSSLFILQKKCWYRAECRVPGLHTSVKCSKVQVGHKRTEELP